MLPWADSGPGSYCSMGSMGSMGSMEAEVVDHGVDKHRLSIVLCWAKRRDGDQSENNPIEAVPGDSRLVPEGNQRKEISAQRAG